MTSSETRKNLQSIQRIHEALGDAYLTLCDAARIVPLPVAWQTFPPSPEGTTQAYVMFGYDGETDACGQEGFDVHANRSEIAHVVFLKVFARYSRN